MYFQIKNIFQENASEQLEFAEAVILSVSDDDSDHGISCMMEELLRYVFVYFKIYVWFHEKKRYLFILISRKKTYFFFSS